MFSSKTNFFFKTIKGKEFFQGKPAVLLRFDDGPDPVYTPLILDLLKERNMRALFAVMGNKAEKYPEIIARMHKENHIIGNHTYSHPYNILLMGYRKIREEIVSTNVILERITGRIPDFFCPPIGQKNPIIGKVIKDLHMTPVMWDVRTRDTHASAIEIVRKIKRQMRPPAILLLHDGILPWSKKDRNATVQALREILKLLEEKRIGYLKP
jgi:peptidoglycan-N-acetylglucosamine deacetylase